MSGLRLAALGVPLLLAGAAIGHATGGGAAAVPAIVAIEGAGAHGATGFVVDGHVVTVAHAVGEDRVVVRGEDGVARDARVVRRDEAADLAVLAVDGAAVPGGTGLPAAGPAWAAGARVLVRRGGGTEAAAAVVVRRIDTRVRAGDGRLLARRPALELRAHIAAGDSGAPVLGPRGEVTGVVFAQSRGRPGVAYAVDVAVLERLLP